MQVGSQQSGRVGVVGWRCLPGPSFVCPRRRSRSGLHLPRPLLWSWVFRPVDPVCVAFRCYPGVWWVWDRRWAVVVVVVVVVVWACWRSLNPVTWR